MKNDLLSHLHMDMKNVLNNYLICIFRVYNQLKNFAIDKISASLLQIDRDKHHQFEKISKMALLTGNFKLDILAVIATLLATIYFYFQWTFQYWKRKNVPYIEPSIPFGSPAPLYKEPLGESLARQYKAVKAQGWKYNGYYLFGRPILFVLDLDLLKHILTKDFNHFVDRGFYVNEENENISGHLFGIGGAKWRKIRKELTPTFTSGKMRQMFQILVDCSKMLEKFTTEVADKRVPVDIKEALACFTTDVIGSCAFGLECNSFKDKDHPFVKYGSKTINVDIFTAVKQYFANSYRTVAKFLNVNFFPKDCHDFYNDIVRKTVEYREKNHVQRNDFLQMLIEIMNKGGNGDTDSGLTLDEVIAQSFVFFIAGYETSSTTMTYALFELAQHPEIQDKVRKEVHRVLEKHNDNITYDVLKEMTYLDQVLDETLRKYPPLPFLTRECTLDYKLPGTDLVVAKGDMVIFSVKGIQYDEEFYENPEVFDPDRFSEAKKKSRNQYAHMPFGEGPRICIGMRFGLTQSKMGLVTILKNYKVSLNAKTKLPLEFVTTSPVIPAVKGGVWLNIEKI